MTDQFRAAPVLLIECDPDEAELVARALRRSDLANPLLIAHSAEDARERLRALASQNLLPQVILLDLELPDGKGLELLKAIKRHQHGAMVPVVVLSQDRADSAVRAAYDVGACSYVAKTHDDPSYSEALLTVTRYWCRLNLTCAVHRH